MEAASAKQIIALFIPILGICIPIIAIIGGIFMKVRREQLLHETVRQLAERGQPVPPELFSRAGLDEGSSREWTPRSQLRFGVINIGVGVGLIILFLAMRPDRWLWAIGCVPLCVGLALLLLWRVESRAAAAGPLGQP